MICMLVDVAGSFLLGYLCFLAVSMSFWVGWEWKEGSDPVALQAWVLCHSTGFGGAQFLESM
jgi:hypothetical protein